MHNRIEPVRHPLYGFDSAPQNGRQRFARGRCREAVSVALNFHTTGHPPGVVARVSPSSTLVFLDSTVHHIGWVFREHIGNLHPLVQRPVQEKRSPMLWTCPTCGVTVDASADRCWGCKQPRPEPEPESRAVSESVLNSDREFAPADEVSETVPESCSCRRLSPPSDMSATQPWTCSKCGETVDAGFLVCWSCGTSIEGVEDPLFISGDETTLGDDEPEAVSFLDNDDLDEPKEDAAPWSCIRCQGPLEPGFIRDFQHGSRMMKPSEWVAGTPQPSFWTGTWTGDQRYPIQAFRCRHCGYLEFRAGGPAEDS